MLLSKHKQAKFLLMLSKSEVFDEKWYRRNYLDQHPYISNPKKFFVEKGVFSGHEPNRFFSSKWYLDQNSDVASANVPPLYHFLEYGENEGRSPHPLFDHFWYIHANPDFAVSNLSPYSHFIAYGINENRSPNAFFDATYYRNKYMHSDEIYSSAILHYVEIGNSKGFNPNKFFDNKWYNEVNHVENDTALEHYLVLGRLKGAKPHQLWDDERYLSSNPDLVRYIDEGQLESAYRHFCEFGAEELLLLDDKRTRRFSFIVDDFFYDFDEQAYRADHVDVERAIQNGKWSSGLEHFFSDGWREIEIGLRKVYDLTRLPALRGRYKGLAPKQGKHACLFVHWDRNGIIDDYVVEYIEKLKKFDIDLYFITTISSIRELEKIRELSVEIVVKNDAGRDFVSWMIAYTELGAEIFDDYDQLILANDSVYFPVNDPTKLFAFVEQSKFDFWSITDSYDWSYNQYHLQSYFVGFNKQARKQLLPQIIQTVRQRPYLSKRGQVIEFEINSTKLAMSLDLSMGSFCPIDDIREDVIKDRRLSKWRPLLQFGLQGANSTLSLWDLLILHYRCPTIKVELLRDNPWNIENVGTWKNVVGEDWMPTATIEKHLDRMKGDLPAGFRPPPAASAIMRQEEVAIREVVHGCGFGDSQRNLVLFAHFDPHGLIDPHVIATIRGLRQANCDVVTITSTDNPDEIAKLKSLCASIILKTPGGRDFGSWQLAIAEMKVIFNKYDNVIWVNDSIYYPLFDPNEMFDVMRGRDLDFWGVTESNTIRWHTMSWFWSFGRRIISDGWFDWFENNNNSSYTKWAQIRNLETRIPGLLKQKGYKVGSFITTNDIIEHFESNDADITRFSGRNDFTMTHLYWDIIIKDFRCPALKVELVRDNPLGMDLSKLRSLISNSTNYDVKLIDDHLRRLNRFKGFQK